MNDNDRSDQGGPLDGGPDVTTWFEGSKVVHGDGTPIVVYRAEHEPGVSPRRSLRMMEVAPTFTSVREVAEAQAGPCIDQFGRAVRPTVSAFHLSIRRLLRLGETAGTEMERFVEWQELTLKLIGRNGITEQELRTAVQGQQGLWRLPVGRADAMDASTPGRNAMAFAEVFRVVARPSFIDIIKRAGYDGLFYRCVFHGDGCVRPNRWGNIGYDQRDYSVDQWLPFADTQLHSVNESRADGILSLTEYRRQSRKVRNQL